MSMVLSRRYALTAACAGLLTAFPAAAKKQPSEDLVLKSAYSPKLFVEWARQVHLTVMFDAKGNGSGTLTFDPNIHDDLRSTGMAIKDITVRVRRVQDDHHAAKGRRLYELKQIPKDDRLRPAEPSWLLSVPTKKGAPCSLLFVGEDGKAKDVVMME
ncbi:MAG TPA: hypothetical protein VM597_13325 [Gemmataceae bacterium]|nr:hypothetical protein [Gemmataceae bacterium]